MYLKKLDDTFEFNYDVIIIRDFKMIVLFWLRCVALISVALMSASPLASERGEGCTNVHGWIVREKRALYS